MASPTRRGDHLVSTPALTADALRAHHTQPFHARAIQTPSSTAQAGASSTDPANKNDSAAGAHRRTLQASSSISTLPSLTKPAAAATAPQTQESKQSSLQLSYSTPNLMQALRDYQNARTASTTNFVNSFHSHHVRTQRSLQWSACRDGWTIAHGFCRSAALALLFRLTINSWSNISSPTSTRCSSVRAIRK
jgi:hypothetical protein